jgi:hypothetical protein
MMDKRAAELMRLVAPWGPMHIAVDDGNMTDGNLDFVESVMRKETATADEWELLRLLRAMSEDERFDLWEAVAYDGMEAD